MPTSLQDMFERRRELAAELATLDREIEAESLRLVSKMQENAVLMQHPLEQEKNLSRKTNKSRRNDLKPPKTQTPIDYETIVSSIYEAYPETKGYTSKRLLAYIKDFGRQQGIVVAITAGRIRKLQAWKEQASQRKSGNTRFGYNLDDFPDGNED